jgi:hypothetical protein
MRHSHNLRAGLGLSIAGSWSQNFVVDFFREVTAAARPRMGGEAGSGQSGAPESSATALTGLDLRRQLACLLALSLLGWAEVCRLDTH